MEGKGQYNFFSIFQDSTTRWIIRYIQLLRTLFNSHIWRNAINHIKEDLMWIDDWKSVKFLVFSALVQFLFVWIEFDSFYYIFLISRLSNLAWGEKLVLRAHLRWTIRLRRIRIETSVQVSIRIKLKPYLNSKLVQWLQKGYNCIDWIGKLSSAVA